MIIVINRLFAIFYAFIMLINHFQSNLIENNYHFRNDDYYILVRISIN